jgi:hypothetical protein
MSDTVKLKFQGIVKFDDELYNHLKIGGEDVAKRLQSSELNMNRVLVKIDHGEKPEWYKGKCRAEEGCYYSEYTHSDDRFYLTEKGVYEDFMKILKEFERSIVALEIQGRREADEEFKKDWLIGTKGGFP